VLALVFVTACLLLGWWQVNRAAAGNALSFGYAIQWPAFAAFAVWVWIAEMRKALRQTDQADARSDAGPQPEANTGAEANTRAEADAPDQTSRQPVESPPARSRPRRPRNEAAYDDSDDPALAAYNHYLAWLNAHPNASPADYPGPPTRKEFTS